MQRYFLTEKAFKELCFTDNDFHHIVHVMRMRLNDQIEVVYEKKAYLATITEISSNKVFFKLERALAVEGAKLSLTLIQGLAKGDKNEEIIKHSTELGVTNIILTEMTYSVCKYNDKFANKILRFNKIAKEAAEQAHRLSIPPVTYQPTILNLNYNQYDLILLLDEEEAKKPDGLTLNKINLKAHHSIAFIIGPEGGISPKERTFLQENGAILVSLGQNILRTETASLAFLAMLKYALME